MTTPTDVSEPEITMTEPLALEENPVADLATELADDIGVRLKAIRERNGLSQRELAKRAGITNSNISMIEQGLVSPSVNSLARVLSGIPMTLAQFFSCNPLDCHEFVYTAAELAQTAELPADGVKRETLAPERREREVSLQRDTFLPGADTGRSPCYAEREYSGILVAGNLELTAGSLVRQLVAGDAFYLVAGQPYRIRNTATVTAEVITATPFNSRNS